MRRTVLGLAAAALLSPALVLPAVADGPPVRVLRGSTPETAVLPDDGFTVPDRTQATGRRVALPVPACTDATRSRCDALGLLNTLDGFDLQPRVFVPFSGDIDVRSLSRASFYVDGPQGRVGFQQITFDPVSHTLAATAEAQLPERARETLVITKAVRDTSGRPIAKTVRVPFTTMSGTTELDKVRKALDDGTAYRQAGITDRALSFEQDGVTTVFPPSDAELITRNDQRSADPSAPRTSSTVPDLAATGAGCYAFGSLEVPRFARPDSTIAPTASTRTPRAVTKERIGVALIVPAGVPPVGGWPVAVYGPGFTRSYFDLFVTSDENAAAGIATIATDPIGHGYGPASTVSVGLPGAQTTFLSYGRGRDLDGDGTIGESEGSQPTKRVTLADGEVVAEEPSANALHGLRGGLEQTASDNMALLRAVSAGVTVPGCTGSPTATLSTAPPMYYGLSFGSIYGTMLMGTDPLPQRGFLNVGGGPIVDIARLSGFRGLLADQLRVSKPSLLNGGPGLEGFTESIPDPLDPPITSPVPGAMDLQRYLAYATWYGRPGGPETYAPLLRLDPRNGTKDLLYQVAYGDNTVPNITSGNIIRAGNLFDVVTYYRNDLSLTATKNPHGFLADPTLEGREQAELQLTAFLKTGQRIDPDAPDQPGANPPHDLFRVPIESPRELNCLHYPNPQTGEVAYDGTSTATGLCPARR